MLKKLFFVVFAVIAVALLALSPGLLSIFGPSGPTQTDVWLRDGISGTYWTNERGLGIMDRTGVLNQLMDAPLYDAGDVMTARAGIIIPNPQSLGLCGYQLSSLRYAWVSYDANGVVVFPGKSVNVAPTDWPLVFYPSDGSRIVLDLAPDSWTGNGNVDVTFVSFSLLLGYGMRANCSDPWIEKLEIFAADGAFINPSVLPPPGDPPVPPVDPPPEPPPEPPIDDPVNGDGGEGETGGFDFSAILPYVLGAVALLILLVVLAFLPIPIAFKVVIFGIVVVVLFVVLPQAII